MKPFKNQAFFSLQGAAGVLGIDRSTLVKWLQKGCPFVTKGDKAKGIEWELSIPDVMQWRIDQAVEEVKAKFATAAEGEGAITIDEAKRRKAVADAIVAEVNADEATRYVARWEDLIDVVADEYGQVRANLSGVGAKVAGRAATMHDAAEIRELVDQSIREALSPLRADTGEASDGE